MQISTSQDSQQYRFIYCEALLCIILNYNYHQKTSTNFDFISMRSFNSADHVPAEIILSDQQQTKKKGYILTDPDFVPIARRCCTGSYARAVGW